MKGADLNSIHFQFLHLFLRVCRGACLHELPCVYMQGPMHVCGDQREVLGVILQVQFTLKQQQQGQRQNTGLTQAGGSQQVPRILPSPLCLLSATTPGFLMWVLAIQLRSLCCQTAISLALIPPLKNQQKPRGKVSLPRFQWSKGLHRLSRHAQALLPHPTHFQSLLNTIPPSLLVTGNHIEVMLHFHHAQKKQSWF